MKIFASIAMAIQLLCGVKNANPKHYKRNRYFKAGSGLSAMAWMVINMIFCEFCGIKFALSKNQLGKYCSRKCVGKSKKTWKEEVEKSLLLMQKEGKTLKEIADFLNKSKGAIKAKAFRLKSCGYRKKWRAKDISIMKKLLSKEIEIIEIAKKLKTTKGAVNWQIHKNALGAAPGTNEFSKKASRRNKKLWNDPKHKFNQPAYRNKLRQTHQDPNSRFNKEEYRQILSDCAHKYKPGLTSIGMGNNRYHGGVREDLGHYVRSRWEANVARYLKWLSRKGEFIKYEYEADCFNFFEIKRGNRSYTPDFKIFLNDGTIEYWEVKGYMDEKSKVKLKRMTKYYPNIKIVIIDKKYYDEIKKWSRLIPNWE